MTTPHEKVIADAFPTNLVANAITQAIRDTFPNGILIDTTKSGPCYELRCGPFFHEDDGPGWAVVKRPDGTREIVDVPQSGVMIMRAFVELTS